MCPLEGNCLAAQDSPLAAAGCGNQCCMAFSQLFVMQGLTWRQVSCNGGRRCAAQRRAAVQMRRGWPLKRRSRAIRIAVFQSHAQPTEPASRAGGEHRLSARASQGRPIWPHCTLHLTRACQQRLQRRPPVRVTVAALTAAPRRRRHRSCFTCRARRPNCEPVSRLGSC